MPEPTAQGLSVAIHGSCVSRDAFSLDCQPNIQVTTYVARHSVISAVSSPAQGLERDASSDQPSWRFRMGRCDAHKGLFELLERNPASVLIIDLMDEQIGLGAWEDTYFTLSPELDEYVANACLPEFKPRRVRPAARMNPLFWIPHFSKYTRRVRELYEPGNIVLHEAYRVHTYTASDGSCRPFDLRTTRNSMAVNIMLWMQYRYLRLQLRGCKVFRTRIIDRSTDAHKWGRSPYHYHDDYYRRLHSFIARVATAEGT